MLIGELSARPLWHLLRPWFFQRAEAVL